MTDYDRYRGLCEREKTIPVFSQAWWMDAVCGKNQWSVFLLGNGMDIVASIVYKIENIGNEKKIGRIPLTQTNGIWIKYSTSQGIISRQAYEERIVNAICDHIETLGLVKYEQQYHYQYNNFLPFFWRYYNQMTRYSYVIEDTVNMEKVREGYSSKLRNKIRKAEKYLQVNEMTDVEEFYRVNKLSFSRQGIEIPYSFEYFYNIYQASIEHNAGKLLCAKDKEGNVHSVAMIVWDKMSVYYLLNGTDPQFKSYQGNDLLIDRSIEVAHNLGLKFDFEGSVIKSVNHAFREFGGTPKPYFRIYKEFK